MFINNAYRIQSSKSTGKVLKAPVVIGRAVMTKTSVQVLAAQIEDRRRWRFEQAVFCGLSPAEKLRLRAELAYSRVDELEEVDAADEGDFDLEMLAKIALSCLPPHIPKPRVGVAHGAALDALRRIYSQHRSASATKRVTSFLSRRYSVVSDTDPAVQLEPLRGGARVTAPQSRDRLDEIAAQLFDEMPWQRDAIGSIWKAARERAGSDMPLPPVILHGEKGWGKSTMARRFAELCGRPHVVIDCASAGAAMRIAGTEKGWGSACPGVPVETLIRERVADPVFILDEIDKSGVVRSKNGTVSSIQDALLPLLEPGTAREWHCPFFRQKLNMSRISWILTANWIDMIPEPLRDRCVHIHCPRPSPAEREAAVYAIARKSGISDPDIVARVISESISVTGISLRGISRIIQRLLAEDERPILN